MKKNSQKIIDLDSLANLPWEEIEEISEEKHFKEKFGRVDRATFIFAAEEENYSAVVDSALKSLQRTDPEHATRYEAERVADLMQTFARIVLKKN